MVAKLKSLLTAPTFEDDTKTSSAAILHTVILLTLVCVAIASLPTILSTPIFSPVLMIFVITLVFLGVMFVSLRRGYVRQTSIAMIVGIGAIITLSNLLFHGPYSPGLGAYTVLVLIVGMLMGRRAALIAAAFSVFIVEGIAIGITLGLVPINPELATPISRATVNSLYYLLAALLLYVAIGIINDGIQRIRLNEQKLTDTLNNLQSTSVSRNYIDNILRSMNNLLLVMDSQGKIQTVNPAALAALGYTEAEVVGAPIQLVFQSGSNGSLNNMEEEHTRSSEAHLIAKNGKQIPVAYTQAMMRGEDGRIEGVVLVGQDISERRAAETERLRNAMRYRALFEQTNDAVFLLNLQGEHLAVNQRAADMLGYSVDELLELPTSAMIVPREHQKNQQVQESLKSGRTITPYERTYLCKDGSEIPVEISVQMVYDGDGKPMHIQSIVRDITERKQIEQRLMYHAMLVDNVSDAIISTNMDSIIQSWNKAAETVYGWKAEEVIGSSLKEVVPTEFESETEDFIRKRHLERGYWRSEVTQRSRDGGNLYMVSSVSVLRDSDGEPMGIVSVNHDITARKLAEMERQNHLTQLAALRQVDLEINHSLDVEDVLQLSLHAASLLSGADAGYILLQDHREMFMRQTIGRYAEHDMPAQPLNLTGILARATQSGEAQFLPDTDTDAECALPDTQAQIVFPFVSHGELTGLLNLETTEPEEFSQEKFDFLRILSSRIAVALDNARLFEKVKNLESLKSDMISIASHDLRGATSVFKGYLEMLSDELKGRTTASEEDYLQMMRGSLNRVQSIVSDILSLKRAEERALSPTDELVDMVQMAHKIVQDSQASAARRQHTLTSDITQAQLLVQADSVLMYEVITNLLENAMKYTPDGGQIQVRLCREGDYARFEVEDNGYGIPEEFQERLFQPFYRAKYKEVYSVEGTGLGLSLVKNIVERFGGKVLFHSIYGKGSTFGFDLPLVPGT